MEKYKTDSVDKINDLALRARVLKEEITLKEAWNIINQRAISSAIAMDLSE